MNTGDGQPVDNVTSVNQQNNNQGKTPAEIAANKLKEAKNKEHQQKVDQQLKVVLDSYNAFKKEWDKYSDTIAEGDTNKTDLNSFLASLK